MARSSIVDKLRLVLVEPINTEMAVVYVLVEIRKVLEHDASKDSYPVLKLYGDWVVHTRLSRSSVADIIVRVFDEVVYRKANDAVNMRLENVAVDFFDERLLRQELCTFLETSGLPTDLCTDEGKWHAFRKSLASVIEEVPSELRPEKQRRPTHFIEKIIVRNKSTDDALNIEWHMEMHSKPIVRVKNGTMKVIGKEPKS